MKIVVSGASGLIGSALVPALERDGHEVLRLVRRDPASDVEVRWDPATGEIDSEHLAGVDAFVNLSGENLGKRWTAARKREILDSRVHSTELVARIAAAAADPKPAVVVASAVGFYGDRGDEVLTEESAGGSGFLTDVVRQWEAAADPARAAGVRVVHLRQGIVIAKEGGALKPMLLPFRLGAGGRLGSGKQWWSWIGMRDLVAAYMDALTTDVAGVVNATAPNPVTNEQFTKALGKALGRPTVVPVPGFAARALFGEMGETMLLGGQRVLPARLLDKGFEFSAPTLDTALEQTLGS
ncbi:MAG TPA: TIGR01777 family oxidoreductase [Gaiellaceae bacterium]|nr:TIGR01777 family oxidoreductase [Gaiellaceae bacterium]